MEQQFDVRRHPFVRATPAQAALVALQLPLIFTTNYDELIESAHAEAGVAIRVSAHEREFKARVSERPAHHLVHDDIRESLGMLAPVSYLPNIGHTADLGAPLPLLTPDGAPTEFPDLGDTKSSFLDAGGDFLVGELDVHLVAMGGIRPNNQEQAEVNRVRVHPAFRQQGFGSALMRALEDSARLLGFRELHLDTATNQPEAVAFYRSLGYKEVGRESRREWTWALMYFTKSLRPT